MRTTVSLSMLFFLGLCACAAETSSPPNGGGSSPAPGETAQPKEESPSSPSNPQAPPAGDTDDPRSVFGAWHAVTIDLFSADSIVGVAPIDANHVWVAVLNHSSLSVRMWNGASWGQPIQLSGVASKRLSGYGLRLVGKGQVWAYGPGILHHLEDGGGKWVNHSQKLASDATWGADGILAIAGWGADVSYLSAQTSAYRWSKGTFTREADPPYAEVIFGASETDAWAFKEQPFGTGSPAIYRRKGSGKWTLLDFGDAGELTYPNGYYGGAASLTPSNLWALGNNEVMRQAVNGGNGFEKVTRPSSVQTEVYNVVWTSSPTNTWVLGSVAYHWDGKAWTKALSDLKGTYYGISGSAPDVVWAYGATSGSWSLYRLDP
jgi:hypothetical protein